MACVPTRPQIDCLIVGAGISGLLIGIKILKDHPKLKVIILEKYNYVGGRVTTYHKSLPHLGKIHWENGAGRISNTHKHILGLIKHYGLHTRPIPDATEYRSKSGIISRISFDDLIIPYADTLRNSLEKTELGQHTLAELIPDTLASPLFDRFPYWAEPNLLRADLALDAFTGDLSHKAGFSICVEGLGELIKCLRSDFEKRGGVIYLGTEVQKIKHDFTTKYDIVSCLRTDKEHPQPSSVQLDIAARSTVLALHFSALKKIFTNSLPKSYPQPSFLTKLKMAPLVRIYAVFPTHAEKSWFSSQPHTVLPSPIRYFIPIQPSKGIVMISYSEGPDAQYWIEKLETYGEDMVKKEVMQHIRSAFPEKSPIPDPIFFKIHPWHDGCTYWLPGAYNPCEVSDESVHPVPDIFPTTFICGESTSIRQAWMEGALEQTEKLYMNTIFCDVLRDS